MSTNHHTPIPTSAAATAVNFNAPLAQLDNAIRLNNYVATTAPTVNDDSGDGYAAGSRWINTSTQRVYVAISVSPGSAVWQELTFPSSIASNFTITGTLTVTGNVTVTGVLTLTGTLAVNTSSANSGSTLTYVGASSSGASSQLALFVNDGAAMASADRIGQIVFGGHNGSSVVNGPFIIAQTTETWSGSARGSKVTFYTVPNTTTGVVAALTLEHTQDATIGGNVNVGSGKVYRVNGTQVVAARATGWAAMTGSGNRATVYDTSTITLVQLATRVKEIQDALTTHGLFGA